MILCFPLFPEGIPVPWKRCSPSSRIFSRMKKIKVSGEAARILRVLVSYIPTMVISTLGFCCVTGSTIVGSVSAVIFST